MSKLHALQEADTAGSWSFRGLQVPSNWVLVKLGAPFWLSILIVSWGVVATMFAGLNSIPQFYALRLLLGVAESGTFPGMWYHLSTFYSEADIGLAYSYVSVGTAISQVQPKSVSLTHAL